MGDRVGHVEVVRGDLHRARIVEEPVPTLAEGEVLLAVDAFGLTANNVSYAVFGDMLGYWQFFPSEGEWGQVPVWGFADVVATAHPDVAEGTRLFGYLPMGTHLVLRPTVADGGTLVDTSPHRAALPGAYNSYRVTADDPLHDPAREDAQMLLWPLYFTAFVLDGFLAANDDFGASTVVLSSASSKTAIGTAQCLARRGGVTVVGLTSAGNVAMVDGLGWYDRVVTYADVGSLPPGDTAVYLDFAGDTAVRTAVHRHYGDRLAHSAIIGGTHWDQTGPGEDEALPGPAPAFFFAPDHWGADTMLRLAEAWAPFVDDLRRWLRIEHREGLEAVRDAFGEALDGKLDPSVGLVLSP